MKLKIRDIPTGLVVLDCDLERLPSLLAYGRFFNSALAIGFTPGRELELTAQTKTHVICEQYTVPQPPPED